MLGPSHLSHTDKPISLPFSETVVTSGSPSRILSWFGNEVKSEAVSPPAFL